MSSTQVGPAVTGVPSAQLNFGKMWRELQLWNPDLDPNVAQRFIQNSYRRIIDSRMWYGLLVKGLLNVPQAYTTGTVAVTSLSTAVVGTGTVWTSQMVGRQFRTGFTTPIFTIAAVADATHLTLDMPWGGPSSSSQGYSIFQNIVSFGSNIKMLLAVVNQQQGYRLILNMPQEVLNIYDTWRTTTGWTFLAADYVPSPTGAPQYELYPAPTYQQSFPFLAYVQPADLGATGDADTPVPFIRSDVVVLGAITDPLLIGGKAGKYYDPFAVQMMATRYEKEMEKMNRVDDAHYMRDMMWQFSQYPFSQYGSGFLQTHDMGV